MSRDLFVYIDESGNFDFSPKGTAWFCLTALATMEPGFGIGRWHEVKYGAIRSGLLVQELKASEDRQWMRDLVFDFLATGIGSLRVDAVAVEKAKLHPDLRAQQAFYHRFLASLVANVIGDQRLSFDRLFVFMDTIPVALKRKAVVGGLKQATASLIPGIPYEVAEFDSRADHLLQLADYCGWALYVARTRQETRPLDKIRPFVASDVDVLKSQTTRYY